MLAVKHLLHNNKTSEYVEKFSTVFTFCIASKYDFYVGNI